MIWVKMYPSIAAYDADHPKSTSWGSKFSTINDGVSVVLLPRGFKRNVLHGKEFRCIQLSPSQDIMREPNMLDKWKADLNLDELEVGRVPDFALSVLIIYGERRDVDMAGATLYKELTERKAMEEPAERVGTSAAEAYFHAGVSTSMQLYP